MHQAIYERLKSVARLGAYVTYTDIAPLADLDMSSPDDRNKIGELLGEISIYEHEQGHPLLSVIVIHRENNIPGNGFFQLARGLNRYDGSDDLLFFIQEFERVRQFWRNQ